MRILCIGDVVGRPGRTILSHKLPKFRKEQNVDFVIVNGENAASGSGLTPKIMRTMQESGIDCVTSGDHIYKNKEVFECLNNPRLLRPSNFGPDAKGYGYGIYDLDGAGKICVINLLGRVFMDPSDCPFREVDRILDEVRDQVSFTIVDMHAEATSEKVAMGWHLDGRVTAVFGTHTHIQTADERVLPKGTAYITDLGMTGPYDSVLGREKERVLYKFRTQMPARFDVAKNDVRMCGVLIQADPGNGLALSVERVEICEES